jgi:hypothetical protein
MQFFQPIPQYNDINAAVALTVNKPAGIEYIYSEKLADENLLKDLKYIVGLTDKKQLKDVLQDDISLLLFSNELRKKVIENNLKGMNFYQVNIETDKNHKLLYWYTHLDYLPKGSLDIKAAGGEIKDYHGVKVYSFIKPVLKLEILEKHGLDYFRIPESKSLEFVSERFKNVFEKNKFTGIEFLPVKTV